MARGRFNYAELQKLYAEKYTNILNIWKKRMGDILISSIDWEGNPFFPEFSVPERFLYDRGFCVAFVDDIYGFMILPATGNSSLNPIGMPSSYMAYSASGAVYDGLVPDENCVVILNDIWMNPGINIVSNYAERMTEIQITWLCNLNANKSPLMIVAEEEDLLSAENFYSQFTIGAPAIFLKNRNANFTPSALRTGAEFIAPELTMELRAVWSEFLTYVGVPSMDINKSERLLRDEVSQAMGGAIASRVPRMRSRKIAAEKIKDLFGIEINPVFAVDKEDLPKYISRDDDDYPEELEEFEELEDGD